MGLGVKNTFKSELVRNSARLISASVIAQVIGLLVYPVLTRMYAPEDFGLLNLFLSIGGVLALIGTAEYQNAILLPKEDERAYAVAHVCTLGTMVLTAILILTIPFSRYIAGLFRAPDLAEWWWLMPIYVLSLSGWQLARFCLLRNKAFGNLSGYQYVQSVVNAGSKLGFGAAGFLSGGLIVSSVIAPVVALGISVSVAWRKVFSALKTWDKQTCVTEAKQFRKFPCFSLPRSLVNYVNGNMPIWVLTPVFGLTEIGFFGMAITLAFLPITMITSSIHQVLFERVANLVREKKQVWKGVVGKWLWSSALIVPIMVALTIVMPWLVRLLLGEGWEQTSTLIRYMMPWITCVLIVSPLAFVSEVFGKQKLFLGVEIIYLTLRVLAMIVGIWMNSFEWAIILISIAGTIILLLQLVLYIIILRRYESTCLA